MKHLSRIFTVVLLSATAWVSAEIAPGDASWPASYPNWWYNAADPANGVIDATKPIFNQDNYSPLLVGQLKHIASEAQKELDSALATVGGAGPEIDALVQPWLQNPVDANNMSPTTIGQLKNVATPFYDRLNSVGFPFDVSANGIGSNINLFVNGHAYPWGPHRETADWYEMHKELAVQGQAKFLFGWDTALASSMAFDTLDCDNDGFLDVWEVANGYDPFDGNDDQDQDGLHDTWELAQGYDPTDPLGDADADGILDVDENIDGDEFTNIQEFQSHLDPSTVEVSPYSPAAPGRPDVTDGAEFTSATLVWADNSDNELMFQIERADFPVSEQAGNVPFRLIHVVPANTTTWTDENLDPDAVYYYRIVARNNTPRL